MAMPDRIDGWTVSMLDALPEDGQRYEIIDGVLHVTPAPRPRHQAVVARLAALLVPYVDRTSAGGRVTSVRRYSPNVSTGNLPAPTSR